MTLYTLITNIQNLAKMEPNIGFITQGDIYSLNHIQDVVYPAFVITQAQHTGSYYNEYENYNITMFLVDRLVEDKSNELDVQSWANTCIQNILHRIEETNLGIVGDVFTVQTFTEKFDSLCAGAYATINIRVPILQCECGCNCGGTPEPGPTPGGGVTEEKVIEIATEIVDEKLVHYVDNETFAELENTVDEKQDKLKYYTEGSNTFETKVRQPGIPGLVQEKITSINGTVSNILINVSEGNEAGSIYLDKDYININTEYLRLGEPHAEKGLKILPGQMYFDNELFYSNGKLVNYYDKTDIDNKIGDINSILNTI